MSHPSTYDDLSALLLCLVWPAGKSSKKDKPRTKSWSDRPTRLEADAVDSEGEGMAFIDKTRLIIHCRLLPNNLLILLSSLCN